MVILSQNSLGLTGAEGGGALSSQAQLQGSSWGVTGLTSWPTSNPLPSHMYRAYLLGEGDRGAYGVELAEPVGEMMTIGICLLGGVGGLLSGMTGAVDSETISSSFPMRLWIRIGRCGTGDDSWLLLERDAITGGGIYNLGEGDRLHWSLVSPAMYC